MANWWNMFQPWIFARGQEYYECGRVVEQEEDGPVIRVQVSGSQLYRVDIQRSGDRVVRMRCDCPYTVGGENYKHMAAVLCVLEKVLGKVRMDWHAALEQGSVNFFEVWQRGMEDYRIILFAWFAGPVMILNSGRRIWIRLLPSMRIIVVGLPMTGLMTAWRTWHNTWKNCCHIKELSLDGMEASILKQYVENNPPSIGDGDAHSMLEMLYCHYGEHNRYFP